MVAVASQSRRDTNAARVDIFRQQAVSAADQTPSPRPASAAARENDPASVIREPASQTPRGVAFAKASSMAPVAPSVIFSGILMEPARAVASQWDRRRLDARRHLCHPRRLLSRDKGSCGYRQGRTHHVRGRSPANGRSRFRRIRQRPLSGDRIKARAVHRPLQIGTQLHPKVAVRPPLRGTRHLGSDPNRRHDRTPQKRTKQSGRSLDAGL